MFEQLWEESPNIQNLRERYLEQGEILALQRLLADLVRARYPDLAEFAQQQAARFDKPDALDFLIQKVMTAPDAGAVRWLLESGTQQQM
jgi:hypothetical protein